MVFVNTRRQADRLEEVLRANHINAQAHVRRRAAEQAPAATLKDFHSGELAVLIATDVASRGLHIPDVSHVFNYDLPQDRADYVHRIGRTARAGAEGDAISFACEDYAICLPEIEEYIGHTSSARRHRAGAAGTRRGVPASTSRARTSPPRRGGGGGGGVAARGDRAPVADAPGGRRPRRWRWWTAPWPSARTRLKLQSIASPH